MFAGLLGNPRSGCVFSEDLYRYRVLRPVPELFDRYSVTCQLPSWFYHTSSMYDPFSAAEIIAVPQRVPAAFHNMMHCRKVRASSPSASRNAHRSLLSSHHPLWEYKEASVGRLLKRQSRSFCSCIPVPDILLRQRWIPYTTRTLAMAKRRKSLKAISGRFTSRRLVDTLVEM